LAAPALTPGRYLPAAPDTPSRTDSHRGCASARDPFRPVPATIAAAAESESKAYGMFCIYTAKEALVPRGGIEPPTRGFSVPRRAWPTPDFSKERHRRRRPIASRLPDESSSRGGRTAGGRRKASVGHGGRGMSFDGRRDTAGQGSLTGEALKAAEAAKRACPTLWTGRARGRGMDSSADLALVAGLAEVLALAAKKEAWRTRSRRKPPRCERPRCGARTRADGECRAPAVWLAGAVAPRNGRCRMHGGLSTGPRTSEGRAKCAEVARRALAARRLADISDPRRQEHDGPSRVDDVAGPG
jgi:hypothetical protein